MLLPTWRISQTADKMMMMMMMVMMMMMMMVMIYNSYRTTQLLKLHRTDAFVIDIFNTHLIAKFIFAVR